MRRLEIVALGLFQLKCATLCTKLGDFEFVEVFVVMRNIGIHERTSELISQLTHIWEYSVKATHLFLSEVEIAEIKPYLPFALWEITHLIVAENESGAPIGFMGIENRKIEMLFISPEFQGKGIGKEFIRHGIETYSINEVTVNEQNPQAIGFYEHMGFMIYKRTDLDEQSRPYPLLYMKR